MIPEPRLEPPEPPQEPFCCSRCHNSTVPLLEFYGGRTLCQKCLGELVEQANIDDLAALLCAGIVENE